MTLRTLNDGDLLLLKKLTSSKTKDAGKNVKNLKPIPKGRKSFLALGYLESNAVPLEILSRRKPASVYVVIL